MTAPTETGAEVARRVGPWRAQKVIVPFPGEKLDPRRPYELSRQTGRFVERMRDADGKVRTFATEAEAIKAATGAQP